MAAGAEGAAGIHADHQALGVLRGHLQPGRQDQQPLPHRIGLPVLFPGQAPIFIELPLPLKRGQLQPEGGGQGNQGPLQFGALTLRPVGLRQPGQQLALQERLRPVAQGHPGDAQLA